MSFQNKLETLAVDPEKLDMAVTKVLAGTVAGWKFKPDGFGINPDASPELIGQDLAFFEVPNPTTLCEKLNGMLLSALKE